MKKRLLFLAGSICFALMFGFSVLAQLPPGTYPGEDCTLQVFTDGSMMETCDDGRVTVWSRHTPIGGCAGAFTDCEGGTVIPE